MTEFIEKKNNYRLTDGEVEFKYHESKVSAEVAASIILEENRGVVEHVAVEFEAYNGYVVVAYPAVVSCDHLYGQCEVRHPNTGHLLSPRPIKRLPVRSATPVASASSGGGSGATPSRGATARVWIIADELNATGGLTRADRNRVIDACVTAGINKATAATQWAKWAKSKGI